MPKAPLFLFGVCVLFPACASFSASTRGNSSFVPAPETVASVGGPGSGGPDNGRCPWRSAGNTGFVSPNPVTVATPFAAPDNLLIFTPPAIPCSPFPITSFGAKGDGATLNTAAFARAVAAAVAAGGGVVIVPAGTWLTGPIHLASNIELHLEAGATVLFSQNFDDYLPAVLTRWEGLDVMNWSPLVYAHHASNVAITGTGTLDGQGAVWGGWKQGSKAEARRVYEYYVGKLPLDPAAMPAPPTSSKINGLRPAFVECNHCTNLLIDGPSITGSPFWTLHPLYSNNVIIRNVHIDTTSTASNGDGVDPDSATNVLIENTTFATSDDCIAIKSGLNEVGLAVNKPSRNIVVRNITSSVGHAGVAIGSEMSGGVNNVLVTNSKLLGLERPIRVKTMPGRGGSLHDLYFADGLTVSWTVAGIELTTQYPTSTIPPHDITLVPTLSRMTFRGISGTGAGPIYSITGPLSGISFDTVTLSGLPGSCTQAGDVSVSASALTGVAEGARTLSCH